MKVIFAHDHLFIPYQNKVFSELQFDFSLWNRYLKVFEEVLIIARLGKQPKNKTVKDLVESSTDNVSFQLMPNISTPINQVLLRRKVMRIMAEYIRDADAVIARLPSEIGLLAIDIACRHHKPWAIEVVTCPWDALWNYGNIQGKIYAPFLTWRIKQAVRKSNFTLYVTDKFLQTRYPCLKGETINCSNVEIPRPSQLVLNQRIKRIRFSKHEKIIFGLIGTLKNKTKGIQTVFATLEKVRSQLPDFEFHILGGGDSTQWQKLARKHDISDLVYFDGTIPGGEPIFRWLDNIDIYLQPSFKEGLPRALIEAMSRGCPCIASNVAGIPELLDKDNLISPGDIDHLGNLLKKFSSSQEILVQEASKNWQKAHDYSGDILEDRRNTFWKKFADYAGDCQIIKDS